MIICKTRVKPFDVLNINRIASMKSGDYAIQLVDECQVKRRKGCTTTDEGAIIRRRIAILKNISIKHSF